MTSISTIWVATVIFLVASATLAQDTLEVDVETGDIRFVEGMVEGDDIDDFLINARRAQIISVDLRTSNSSAYFNITPLGSQDAIFIGSTSGRVADVPAPADGTYVVRVYLVRSAARRGETADYTLGLGLGAPEFADSLSGGPDYWAVNIADGGALNLRAGPSTQYPRSSILRKGDVLQNRGCRMTGSERWCSVRVTGSGVTGWVAGRFLVETAPPRPPRMPEGGPVGNGNPFDATGMLPCATAGGQAMRQCPFGVIRGGPGNVGVWIALGGGTERQFLFENGHPVATDPAGAFEHETDGDLTIIRMGEQRFEIPAAVIYGG